jgi:uncharacterized protein (TIGR00369 family)
MSKHAIYSPVHAHRFPPLPPERAARWTDFMGSHSDYFPGLVGIKLEEARTDYSRMRMPFRSNLKQPAGLVHGGAIATLIDTVVVPAIGSGYDVPHRYITIDMQIQYIGALAAEEDAIAEGWIVKRGRSIVFCRAEVFSASAALIATGTLTYTVRPA